MAGDTLPFDAAQVMGVLLIAILLNAYFFGFVCQQLYSYWISRFDDPVHVKAFVVAQFCVVVLQGAILWDLAWNVYIVSYALITDPKSVTWQAFANSLCQVVLIMMANAFLAHRIYTLTQSRLQSGLVLAFSSMAFIVGVVNLSTTWKLKSNLQPFTHAQLAASGIWHGLQAIAECFIMYFLTRALLKSRSGMKTSDSIVHHFVRNAVQSGLFATIWSLAALGTYFLLPKWTIYTIFDLTSGSIYTHMIFDGLLSRTRLRGQMAERTELGVAFPSQTNSNSSPSQNYERKRTSAAAHGAVSLVTMADFRTGTQITEDLSGNEKDTNSEFEGEPSRKPGAGDDLSV